MSTIIYCRVTSQSQARLGKSLKTQEFICREHIAIFNPFIIPHVVKEVSSVYKTNPPVIRSLLTHQNTTFVFRSIENYSRDSAIGIANALHLINNNCFLVFVNDGITLSRYITQQDWDFFVNRLSQSESYSKSLSDNKRDSKRRRLAEEESESEEEESEEEESESESEEEESESESEEEESESEEEESESESPILGHKRRRYN
jgi:flagellar biosynthesis GTPase FlhF